MNRLNRTGRATLIAMAALLLILVAGRILE
jgi:hypothetical protein